MEKQLVHIHVDKQEVLLGDFTRMNQFVKEISNRGKILFQSVSIFFSGYDDDPRELFEIDEVREWTRKFVMKNPHIFYFLDPDFDADETILLIIADNLETFYHGEKYSIAYLLDVKGLNFEELPQQDVYISLKKETYKALERGILTYAKRIRHMSGGRKVVEKISRFYKE